MALSLLAASTGLPDPQLAADFWATMLRRPVHEQPGALVLPGDRGQLTMRFTTEPRPKIDADRWHWHLTSESPEHQDQTVERAIELGARHLDIGQRPEEGHVVLIDPSGIVFCVIEPHEAYLAGTGYLGELAGTGTYEVGLFWRDALGWPLVWDKGEETVIQLPIGGTKVAWGGRPFPAKTEANRERFIIGTDGDLGAEVQRLTALGATRLRDLPDGVELADLDGNEFELWPTARWQ